MKKIVIFLLLMSQTPLVIAQQIANNPRRRAVRKLIQNRSTSIADALQNKYTEALNQVHEHLQAAEQLTPTEKRILINKLIGYFNPPTKADIELKSQLAQLLYTTITKAYNDILSLQKEANYPKDLAQQFAEQVLGKILLHKKSSKLEL